MTDSRTVEFKQTASSSERKDPVESKNYLPSQLLAACLEAPTHEVHLQWPKEKVGKRKEAMVQIISILRNPDFSMGCPTTGAPHLLPLWLDTINNSALTGIEATQLEEPDPKLITFSFFQRLICYEKMGGTGAPKELKTAETLDEIERIYEEEITKLEKYKAKVAEIKGVRLSSLSDPFDSDEYYIWLFANEAYQAALLQGFAMSLDPELGCSSQGILLLKILMDYTRHEELNEKPTAIGQQLSNQTVEQHHFIVKKLFELCIRSASPASKDALAVFLEHINTPMNKKSKLSLQLYKSPLQLHELVYMDSFKKIFVSCSDEKINLIIKALDPAVSKPFTLYLINIASKFCLDELKSSPNPDEPVSCTLILRTIPFLTNGNIPLLSYLGMMDNDTIELARICFPIIPGPDAVMMLVVQGSIYLAAGLNASYFFEEIEKGSLKELGDPVFLASLKEANEACAQRTVDYVHSTLSFFPPGINKMTLEYARWHQPQLPSPF